MTLTITKTKSLQNRNINSNYQFLQQRLKNQGMKKSISRHLSTKRRKTYRDLKFTLMDATSFHRSEKTKSNSK